MNVIEELVAVLGFDVRGEQDAERFSGKLDNIGNKAGAVAAKFAMFATGVATAAAGATVALFAFVNPVAAEFDALIKQADQLSVSFEALQGLGFAAEQSGGSIEALSGSIRSMDQRLAEAARGTGRAKTVLEAYGLSAVDAEGNTKNAHDMMLELADVFDQLGTQERQDIARAFGIDQGTLNMLAQGRDAIEALTDEAERRGLVFDEEAARNAEIYNDQMNAIQRTWRAMRQRLALDLLPTMTRWMGAFDGWLMANREMISMRLDQGLQMVASGIEGVGKMALSAGRSIRWLSQQIENLTGVGTGGQMAALGAGAGLWLASRHPVLAGLAAAFLMLDDLRAYAEGENSVIGSLLDEMEKVEGKTAEWREKMNASFAEEGKPELLEDDWLSQVIQQLKDFDQALVDFIGPPPEILMPRIDMSSVWAGFENWWDDLVQGFHDAGARAGAALVEGLREAIRSLLPESLLDMLGEANRGQAAAAAGRAVGGMVPPPSSGRGDRLAPTDREGDLRRRAEDNARDLGFQPNTDRFGPADAPDIQGLDDLRSRLEGIHDGLSQVMDLSIRPHDVQIDRSVDFDQHNSITIHQNVTGAASGAAAGSAVEGALDRSGRRAADIAAQEPSLQ